MSKLTDKQLAFIEHYLACNNATEAALRAGYAPKRAGEQGYQLLQKTPIRAEIESRKAEVAKELKVTKESLINDLLHIKDIAMDNTKVQHNAIKAIEVISKMLGLNEPDKIDHTTNGKNITPTITLNIVPPKNDQP